MGLTSTSYIRTHKQSIVHSGELTRQITDFKNEYFEIYLDVMSKVEEFQKNLITNSL